MKIILTLKRHKLLKILFKQSVKDKNHILSYDFLCDNLNVEFNDFKLITSQLFKDKEILNADLKDCQLKNIKEELTKMNSSGLFITDIGINSVSNNKYINLIKEYFSKIIFKIIIPLALFTMTVFNFTHFNNISTNNKTEISLIKKKLKSLKEGIKSDSLLLQNLKTQNVFLLLKIDSLENSFIKNLDDKMLKK